MYPISPVIFKGKVTIFSLDFKEIRLDDML